MKKQTSLFVVFILVLSLYGCGSNTKILDMQQKSDEAISSNAVLQMSENASSDLGQEQADKYDCTEKVWDDAHHYFGVWEEKIPELRETAADRAIAESLEAHAAGFKEQFQTDLEEWFSLADSMDQKEMKSHQDWISENGILRGYFVVEEIVYQGKQYIAFLVKCGDADNITPSKIYRYQIYSYNLENGAEMTLGQYSLSNEEWKELLRTQYRSLCKQSTKTYKEAYIDYILENFDFKNIEKYENDLCCFTDKGIMFYFNSKITEQEIVNGFSAVYPGIAWDEMQEFNHILIPYEIIDKGKALESENADSDKKSSFTD